MANRSADVLIVGGGVAGASCAGALREHGVFSAASAGVLLDRSVFAAINLDGTNGDGLQSDYRLTLTSGG